MGELLHCLLTLSLLAAAMGMQAGKQKLVTTLLDAKWKDTPLLLEISEYLADESREHFWEYVNGICDLDPEFILYKNDKEYYDLILSEAKWFISPAQISVLKLVLALRIYSPKIEMYHQMALNRGVSQMGCDAVADVNGQLTCDVHEVTELVEKGGSKKPEQYQIDHVYPTSGTSNITVVLYGRLGQRAFRDFHILLKRLAKIGHVNYIFRHFVREQSDRNVRLSGYGVELQIKSTEYKAQDDTKVKDDQTGGDVSDEEEEEEVEGFIFSKLKTIYPDKIERLEKFRVHLLEESNELAPLKVWQLQELSLQAAERIMSSPRDEALKVITQIAQNFPLQARSLVRTALSSELKKEVKRNQELFMTALNLQPTDTALFINGIYFDMDFVDIFTLLETIRQEQRVMEGLSKLGIQDNELHKLLNLDFTASNQDYAVDIRDTAVNYFNDVEHDKQFKRWPSSLTELLRPTFPGMLRNVRKNIYHIVIIADPSKNPAKPLLKLFESFHVHSVPLRLGLVFAVNSNSNVCGKQDAGVAMLNAFNYIVEQKDNYQGLSFITDVYAAVDDKEVEVKDVMQVFRQQFSEADVEEVFGEDSEYDVGRQLAKDFVEKTGLRRFPQALVNGIPLNEKVLNSEDFEEAVLMEIMKQTPTIQKAVYNGDLTDSHNVLDYLMSQPTVMPRLNDRILHGKNNFVVVTGNSMPNLTWESFVELKPVDMSATVVMHMKYLTRKDDNVFRPLTYWIVTDLETAEGRDMLNNALQQMKLTNSIRIGIINNPSAPVSKEGSYPLSKAVFVAMETFDRDTAKQYIGKIMKEDTAKMILQGKKKAWEFEISGADMAQFQEALHHVKFDFLKIHQLFCEKVLNFKPGQSGIVTNGKIIGPLDSGEKFTFDDFSLLEKYTMSTYGEKISDSLQDFEGYEDVESEKDHKSNIALQVSAMLVSRPSTRTRYEIQYRSDKFSVLKLPPRIPDQPSFDITAIFDPVSRGAQKVAPLLMVLQEVINCQIRVFLNCQEKHSEMPLKSFYRYVLEPEVLFTSDGNFAAGPMARFHNMPPSPILTLNMHVPDNWLVEVVVSPHDLDNIHLEDVESVVHSEFELEHLLLEGHCFEQSTGNPPRGLQITLGNNQQPVIVDTIVMANLGYLQLKASPGAWILRLRQGRSAEIYDIVSHEGSDTPVNSTDIKVLISSFRSATIKLKVSKKPDKMHMELLGDEDGDGGIWNSITSTFSSSKKPEDEDDVINIFSLASGHLYERFLRIMMLSVLKNTKTPVKFWFLKNYLSPTFKDYLPHMAHEYGFEYELVQYKWPRWLHQQTEKQRLIWGYKILFLDVLFPLDVKKIIFVDADQVVRADMKELRDLDLGAAPYGYTPFCDSRREMEGFRFWKQGYWKSHLQGRKYHISALYVVDLRRFRRIAAGDRLRGQYQALSQDPNSLSNLDQDLPNNMIHQVAIKSLPQEWLWCETWCDDASKKYAKTIDLCNNPQTKEAKLTAAMRIIAEWSDYDNEQRRLQERIEGENVETEKNENDTVESGSIEDTEDKPHEHEEL